MKNKLFIGFFLTLYSLIFLNVGIAAKANFSGNWKLDTTKSQGLPPGMEQSMKVKHDGDNINLETKITTPNGDHTDIDAYKLDGKSVELSKVGINNQKQKIKRVAEWAENGGIKVLENIEIEAPDGSTTPLVFKRNWTLSSDGKTLLIEIEVEAPQGKQVTKRTFVKI